MSEENTTFSQEQVNEKLNSALSEWEKEYLQPLQTEVEELRQYKPVEKSDAEKALEEKEKSVFDKQVNLTLKEHGLEGFKDVLNIADEEDLNNKVESLNKIVQQQKLNNSYKPEDHKKENEFDKYEKEGNTVGMIGSKLGNLFK